MRMYSTTLFTELLQLILLQYKSDRKYKDSVTPTTIDFLCYGLQMIYYVDYTKQARNNDLIRLLSI